MDREFRRLRSTVPKRVTKYMKRLEEEWDKHQIDAKYEKLLEMDCKDASSFEMELNKLDQQITELMVYAERKCTLLSSHHLDSWSPKLIGA